MQCTSSTQNEKRENGSHGAAVNRLYGRQYNGELIISCWKIVHFKRIRNNSCKDENGKRKAHLEI